MTDNSDDRPATFPGFDVPHENWSKLPHAFIDALNMVETVGELKTILYILRHTWGYHDDQKKITLDEFANGRKRRDGSRIDGGTGLSIPTIRNGLERAEEHGFIVVETDDRDKARVKKFYSLSMQGQKQTEKVLQSDCKTLTIREKKIYNRTEKDTSERHPEKEKDSPSETEKRDYVSDLARHFDRPKEENWSVPAEAGGADDWAVSVDAFAGLVGVPPPELPASTRKEWSRVLREIGGEWRAGPQTLAEVIGEVPDSEFHWKTYASPHGARADLGVLIGQHRNGGVRKAKKGNGNSQANAIAQIAAYKEKLRAEQEPAFDVDAEFAVKGAVL